MFYFNTISVKSVIVSTTVFFITKSISKFRGSALHYVHYQIIQDLGTYFKLLIMYCNKICHLGLGAFINLGGDPS